MIRPGINENILITKIEMTDKGRCSITVKEAGAVAAESGQELDDFHALMEEGVTPESSGIDISIQIFPFTSKKNDGTPFTIKGIGEEIKRVKNLFLHLLSAYQPVGNISFKKIYDGTGITDSQTYERGVQDDGILKVMFTNLAGEFIEHMAPHLAEPKPVRILLLRRSKEVHYVKFRDKFLSDNPMIEPMDIPAKQSKLAFTQYELDKGLDNPNQVAKTDADPVSPDGAAGTSVPAMDDDLPFGPPMAE